MSFWIEGGKEILLLLAEQTGKTISKNNRQQQLIDTYWIYFREAKF